MIHPSYSELMTAINENPADEAVVNSRYSIVIASAKRARQIIAGDEPMVDSAINKPLSIAVEELYTGKVKILAENEETEEVEIEE